MRYAPPGMCLNDFAVIGTGPYHLLHLQGPWTDDFDAARMETSYGRASSADLITWEPQAPVFGVGLPERFDDAAVWTMHPFPHGDGLAMAYTGVRRVPHLQQSVGMAFSDRTDGTGWRRATSVLIRPDPRWYLTGPGEAWRDPWVHMEPEPEMGHVMLVAARVTDTPLDRAGCVGMAVSADLEHWEVLPPLLVPGDVDEFECPVLEPCPGGGWLLLGSIAPERQIFAWWSARIGADWTALGPIAPPGPYAPRVVAGPAGERLLLHTVPRQVGLRDDGTPCRGMLAQPKLLEATSTGARLRWWPGLSQHLGPLVEHDRSVRDAVTDVDVDGAGGVTIRDDGGPHAVTVEVVGRQLTARAGTWQPSQRAILDRTPQRLRIFAVGEFIEVYADDILSLSLNSYASNRGPSTPLRHSSVVSVHLLAPTSADRDDVSTPWPGPTQER